jgi:hypothetical protein
MSLFDRTIENRSSSACIKSPHQPELSNALIFDFFAVGECVCKNTTVQSFGLMPHQLFYPIFYDPQSYQVSPHLWSRFQRLSYKHSPVKKEPKIQQNSVKRTTKRHFALTQLVCA